MSSHLIQANERKHPKQAIDAIHANDQRQWQHHDTEHNWLLIRDSLLSLWAWKLIFIVWWCRILGLSPKRTTLLKTVVLDTSYNSFIILCSLIFQWIYCGISKECCHSTVVGRLGCSHGFSLSGLSENVYKATLPYFLFLFFFFSSPMLDFLVDGYIVVCILVCLLLSERVTERKSNDVPNMTTWESLSVDVHGVIKRPHYR